MKLASLLFLLAAALVCEPCVAQTSISPLRVEAQDLPIFIASLQPLAEHNIGYGLRVFRRSTDIPCEPSPLPADCDKATLVIVIVHVRELPIDPVVAFAFETSAESDWRFGQWIALPKTIGSSPGENAARLRVEKREILDGAFPGEDYRIVWVPYEVRVNFGSTEIAPVGKKP
jgi:hypothetical protein